MAASMCWLPDTGDLEFDSSISCKNWRKIMDRNRKSYK
jgi:hypothetical protein